MSSIAGPLSSRTDDQLGRAALAGDRDAFTELFARHEGGLFNVAHRLTGSREDAADITQEAFLRVFARLDELGGREVNLTAYLHRTARNLVYDRSARRAREAPTEDVERAAGADTAMEADPELTTLVGAQGRDVQAANARLPERQRLVLALRELEDMGYEDIGRVLDVTPGAVGQLLARARMALRRELRLEQVDLEWLAPGCRARLGDIGALIDGELGPDRAQVLTAHLASCEACRASRASFEEARVTYRAWLPLPVLGLGAATARAAEDAGLVRFADAGAGGGPASGAADAAGGGGDGPGGPGRAGGSGPGGAGDDEARRRRRRAAGIVLAGILALLLLIGVPTLVAVRTGSDATTTDAAPAAAPPTTAAAAPAPPPTTAKATTASDDPAPATAAPATAAAQAPPPADEPASPQAAPVPGTTTAAAAGGRRAPARTVRRPPATAAAPPATTQPPAVTEPPPPPPATPPPPAVTDPPRTDPRRPTAPTPARPRPPTVTLPPVAGPPIPPPPVP